MADQIARGLIGGGSARIVAAITTDAVREAVRRHGAVAGAAVAMARAMTAGLLLATLTKDRERVTLQILGDGPMGGITVDANAAGEVRAYARNAAALVTAGPGYRANVSSGVGRNGIVSVIRDLGLRELYTGQAPIHSGEVDEDVESYLHASEQIDSGLGCDAVLDDTLDVRTSGGFLIQALPGSDAAPMVAAVRDGLRTGSLHAALRADSDAASDPVALARALLGAEGAGLDVLNVRPLRFQCRCSRDRAAGTLAAVGRTELEAILREDGRAEITCNFCGARYNFSREDLQQIHRSVVQTPS